MLAEFLQTLGCMDFRLAIDRDKNISYGIFVVSAAGLSQDY
jgi:hypothetical protein